MWKVSQLLMVDRTGNLHRFLVRRLVYAFFPPSQMSSYLSCTFLDFPHCLYSTSLTPSFLFILSIQAQLAARPKWFVRWWRHQTSPGQLLESQHPGSKAANLPVRHQHKMLEWGSSQSQTEGKAGNLWRGEFLG